LQRDRTPADASKIIPNQATTTPVIDDGIQRHQETPGRPTDLGSLARSILDATIRRMPLDASVLRRFAEMVIARDSLGALALRVAKADDGARRAAVELAGAILAREAVDATFIGTAAGDQGVDSERPPQR
jgi:hypothetical protein